MHHTTLITHKNSVIPWNTYCHTLKDDFSTKWLQILTDKPETSSRTSMENQSGFYNILLTTLHCLFSSHDTWLAHSMFWRNHTLHSPSLLPAPKPSVTHVSHTLFTWYYTNLSGVCTKSLRGCLENCTHLHIKISLFYPMMVLPEGSCQLQLWASAVLCFKLSTGATWRTRVRQDPGLTARLSSLLNRNSAVFEKWHEF